MDKEEESLSSTGLVKCCNCVNCSCNLSIGSSTGTWIRSVKRKYDEFENSNRFYIPGFDLHVARVGIENECAALRETLSSQQQTIQDLYEELEEERNASSSAASEAMSMMLRLQKEKAEIEMEARQFKRFAEEKMAHDAQEIAAFEDVLYRREQTIQSLTCEVQSYKHRMISYGLTESEAEGLREGYSRNQSFSDVGGQMESPSCAYPQLRCNLNDSQGQSEYEDDVVDVEKYPFGETPRGQEQLKNLEFRINQLERGSPRCYQLDKESPGGQSFFDKGVVNSPRRSAKHARRFSTDSSNSFLGYGRDDYPVDSPRFGTSVKKLDCVAEELRKSDDVSEYGDDMSDRVYTIDSIHHGGQYKNFMEHKVAPGIYDEYGTTPRGPFNRFDFGDPDIKKLYLRLQALEADRESMRQTIISMQTDKAQLVFLREIAQQLCKDMSTQRPMPIQRPSLLRTFSFFAVFRWIFSFVFWRKKAHKSKYMFGMSPDNAGLLMLLDKGPRTKQWRCVSSTQL